MTNVSRRRILAGVAAGLMAASFGIAATPGTATAATGQSIRLCAMRPLPFPADAYRATADAVDPTGRFIAGSGRRNTAGGATEPLLLVWDEGQLTTVASPLVEEIAGVNADGAVIGNGWVNGVSQPWRYRAGQLESLPTGTFSYVGVSAINGSGNIVGSGYTPTGEQVALLWPAARPGTVEVLDAPANAAARDITDDGTIVGSAGDFGAWTGWVRTPAGEIQPLTLAGATGSQVDAASGRYVIGRVNLGEPNQVRVRWDLVKGTSVTLDPRFAVLSDVNQHGVVVGGDRISRGASSVVLPGGGTGITIGARAIADNGTVVGFHNSTRVTAVRWTGC
ncbi:hypothetical protein ACVCAH_30500 [Micromonospora sp. LZ34]